MLAGRYPSDEFAELRPRIVWDRTAGVVRGRAGRAAARGHERGHDPRPRPLRRLPGRRRRPRRRARRGDGLRGAPGADVHARRLDVADRGDHARPRARLAGPGRAGRGAVLEGRGRRPAVRARARRSVAPRARSSALSDAKALERLGGDYHLDPRAAKNLLTYLREQAAANGGVVPSDRTIVVERFRDEIGDWRLCILTPFGARVHAPWAMALGARLRDALGLEVQSIWSDDGIALAPARGRRCRRRSPICCSTPDEIEELVVQELGQTALFGARFRENAGRALLIPRRRPGQRTPLWQQRLKAQSLLQVARNYGSFPIVLETYRECLQDVFDLPALKRILHGLQTRELDLVEVETAVRLAVRLVAALRLRRDVHVRGRHAGGRAARAGALARPRPAARAARRRRSCATCSTRPRSPRSRRSSPATRARRRAARPAAPARRPARRRGRRRRTPRCSWRERRALRVRIGGEERLIAAEDAGLFRDALGVMPPGGLPEAFLEPVPDALGVLLARFARSRGPFTTAEAAARYGARAGARRGAARRARARRPARPRRAPPRRRRARVVRSRRAAAPAPRVARGAAQGGRAGRAGRASAASCPPGTGSTGGPPCARRSSRCRRSRCPSRSGRARCCGAACPGYQPAWLDALCATGEVVWVGAGLDRVALYFRDDAPLLGAPAGAPPPEGEAARGAAASRSAARPSSGPTCSPRRGSTPRRRCPRSGSSSGPVR